MKGAFKDKTILELGMYPNLPWLPLIIPSSSSVFWFSPFWKKDSGCGLLGIITALMGASVIFTAPTDHQPILKGNINLNCPNQEPDIMEFDWYVVFTSISLIFWVFTLDTFRSAKGLTIIFWMCAIQCRNIGATMETSCALVLTILWWVHPTFCKTERKEM